MAGDRLPETKLLLMATFPRDAQPDTPFRREISHLNRLIQKFRWVLVVMPLFASVAYEP